MGFLWYITIITSLTTNPHTVSCDLKIYCFQTYKSLLSVVHKKVHRDYVNTSTLHHPGNLYHSFSSPTVNDEFKINGSLSSRPYKMSRGGARAMPWQHIRKWQDSTTNLNHTTRCEARGQLHTRESLPLARCTSYPLKRILCGLKPVWTLWNSLTPAKKQPIIPQTSSL
jgi:hypothetical protein